MESSSFTSSAQDDRRRRRAAAIEKLIHEFAPCENEDLLAQMVVTICRLGADGADRGDLKILNTALKELRYAFKVFTPYADIPKVSMFGSARTPEDHPQYQEAKKFAELMQQDGWMVITGAGDGIMRAGHHGATQEASFGVAISLPFEQAANPYIARDPKLVHFKYFFTRKLMFVKEARAIALFPGGFGTQDEGFEALTLVQTLKSVPVPIVLCHEPGGTYWTHWLRYVKEVLLAEHMIDPTDLELFRIVDRAEEAVAEIKQFYRRYHSSRYVGNQFVIRLNESIENGALRRLEQDFGDIVAEGQYELHSGPLDGEDGAYPDKARLSFVFDRRSASRLRQLIDAINANP